jgi:hypothetical protein
MQRGDPLLAVVPDRRLAFLEEFGQPIPHGPFPLADQHRVHLILPRQLRHRFHSDYRLQANFGFESATVLFAFSFHRSALSHREQTSKRQA